MPKIVPTLLVTGPIGVGKSTAIEEMSVLLRKADIRHAAVDFDLLTSCYPRPPEDDDWGTGIGLKNLAAVWKNYAAAGIDRLLMARVVEDRSELEGYRTAVPGADIMVVRLRASVATLLRRIRARHLPGVDPGWQPRRARELARQMEERPVEDILVETDRRSPARIAAEILRRAGWLAI